MDAIELRTWLRRHGATDAQADAPPICALYDLGFAYPVGVFDMLRPGRRSVVIAGSPRGPRADVATIPSLDPWTRSPRSPDPGPTKVGTEPLDRPPLG